MGLFSKFLGKELGEAQAKKLEETGAQLLGKLFSGETPTAAEKPADAQPQPAPQRAAAGGNDPYGDTPPAEENSFTFAGPYQAYFRRVFAEEFPACEVVETPAPHGRGTLFTFVKNGDTALVVEVMSEGCSSQRVRRDCERAGKPYLRYYYDHRGWWNTRSYVRDRTGKALGL